jgi:hypothetical protein
MARKFIVEDEWSAFLLRSLGRGLDAVPDLGRD